MRRRTRALLVALLAIGFIAGIVKLFTSRFESGEVYPAYSTYRRDPLGARALYESLAMQRGISVTRNTLPLDGVHARGATVFLLGVYPGRLNGEMAADLDRLAGEGARLVIAFPPEWRQPEKLAASEQTIAPKRANDKKPAHDEPSFEQKLGFSLRREQSTMEEFREQFAGNGDLPRHTALWFDHLAPQWTVLQTWHDHPVAIERPWKTGSIALVAESWMLSNDGLAREPDAGAVARLVGPNHTIVFDESHLGIVESGSVAGLVRRYHLEGAVLALLALAALFIWKNAVPFPPRSTATHDDGARLRGASAAEGLVCLLSRSIPAKQLARVCASEYKTLLTTGSFSEWQRERLESALAACARYENPAAGYQAMQKTLEEIRHPWKRTS